MAADLRSVVARLTTFKCTWTAEEVQSLTDVPLSGVRRYLSTLAHLQVLVLTDGKYSAGPKARAWREKEPTRKGPSTYGNSAKYRAQRAVWDALRLRDWQSGKSKPAHSNVQNAMPLTSNEVQAGTTAATEVQPMTSVSHQPPLTYDEAATLLGVSLNTVRNEVKRGKLKAFRVGERGIRITHEALDEYRTANAVTMNAKV